MPGLDLRDFQSLNATRGARWHNNNLQEWSPLEWAGAMCGEAGEAANFAKKLRRLDTAIANKEHGVDQADAIFLRKAIADEVADAIIYGLLLLSVLDMDASTVIANKFNQKSIEYGFAERVPNGTLVSHEKQHPPQYHP